ncbi:hypothetical protein BSKO_11461 [Bryopsis sp. KO-2023]|nr:hypothetical protein BSKO_11461 [Bryopsis sp. KO-2023]
MIRRILLAAAEGLASEGEEGVEPMSWGKTVIYGVVSACLVLFAGFVSGLSLGLMSQDRVDMMVLMRSGTTREKGYASKIMPVIKDTHFTLVTLLLCNAIALEALPIFLNKLIGEVTAIILSVTVVLVFGEIVPQALCVRYGLVIGAYTAWLVRVLRIITFPVSYPVSKILDWAMGADHTVLFKRQQLKALVAIHHADEGLGGKLSEDEVNVIVGALDMHTKTAESAMTPISKVFMLSSDANLDYATLKKVVDSGHSRIPVHAPGNRKRILGCLLTKDLVLVNPSEAPLVKSRPLREIPRLPSNVPMYDALNLFQVGKSHIALLTEPSGDTCLTPRTEQDLSGIEALDPIGIVTLEDVFEELLQEEIVDETDIFVDNLQTSKVNAQLLTMALPPHLRRWLPFASKGQQAELRRRFSDVMGSYSEDHLASPSNPNQPLLDPEDRRSTTS